MTLTAPASVAGAGSRDKAINIARWRVSGLFMPDELKSFKFNGQTFVVGANEGDARDWPGAHALRAARVWRSRLADHAVGRVFVTAGKAGSRVLSLLECPQYLSSRPPPSLNLTSLSMPRLLLLPTNCH